YGTIEGLIAHVEDLKGKKKENLQAFLPNLETTRKLVTLDTHMPITPDWPAWRVQEWDGPKLVELFRGWGFRSFAEQARATIKEAPPRPKSIVQGSLFGEVAGDPNETVASWPHTYHLVDREDAFASFLTQLKQQRRFAIDLETTLLDPRQADIVGLA